MTPTTHILPIITLLSLTSPALACNPQCGPCAGSTAFATSYGQQPAQGPQIDQQTQQWVQSNQRARQSYQAPAFAPQAPIRQGQFGPQYRP